ncbi:MAG: MMPL family transporter, partial [Candidatus Margulisbacteria bacterium]|nr:MMPL family transporter [Candidatus Margulisiibacteriota bacterium]
MMKSKTYGEKLVDGLIKWKWMVLAIVLSVFLFSASGSQFITFNNSYRIFFGKDNPQLKAFDELQNVYTKNDSVLIAIEPKDGNVFDRALLSELEDLTLMSWQVPFSTRVDSITNFQHVRANDNDLLVKDLIVDAESLSDEEMAYAKKVALHDPLIINRLISPKADITAINITVNFPEEDPNAAVTITNYVRKMMGTFEASHPEVNVYLSGTAVMSDAFAMSSQKDMSTLYPIMYIVIVAITFLLLKSILA